jgi:hypothetical protein
MLANIRLRYPVFALPKFHRKKKPAEKNLERLKPITNYAVPSGAMPVCVSRTWMAQCHSVSFRGKEFLDTCSEYQGGRVRPRSHDAIQLQSELLRHDCESQRDEDCSRRTNKGRTALLLHSPGERFLWCGADKGNVLGVINSRSEPFSRFSQLFICNLARVRGHQIATAFIHREPSAVHEVQRIPEKAGDAQPPERFSHHRGKEGIRQTTEAQLWNELGSESASISHSVLELTAEGNQNSRRKT